MSPGTEEYTTVAGLCVQFASFSFVFTTAVFTSASFAPLPLYLLASPLAPLQSRAMESVLHAFYVTLTRFL